MRLVSRMMNPDRTLKKHENLIRGCGGVHTNHSPTHTGPVIGCVSRTPVLWNPYLQVVVGLEELV